MKFLHDFTVYAISFTKTGNYRREAHFFCSHLHDPAREKRASVYKGCKTEVKPYAMWSEGDLDQGRSWCSEIVNLNLPFATYRYSVALAVSAVCRAHPRDLQLMKLGCSRVACQINMSPAPFAPRSDLDGKLGGLIQGGTCVLAWLCSWRPDVPVTLRSVSVYTTVSTPPYHPSHLSATAFPTIPPVSWLREWAKVISSFIRIPTFLNSASSGNVEWGCYRWYCSPTRWMSRVTKCGG